MIRQIRQSGLVVRCLFSYERGTNMKNLNEYFELCKTILDDCGISYSHYTTIKANNRLTACYGRTKRLWGKLFDDNWFYVIDINSTLLSDSVGDKALENTILHELLHTCRGCFNHGDVWKRYAQIVNEKFGYDIKRCGGDKDDSGAEKALIEKRKAVSPYKYKLYCHTCGATWYYKRKTRAITSPGIYRCGKCKTTLVSAVLTNEEKTVANK